MPLSKYIQTVIGLPLHTELLDKYKVADLKRQSNMSQADFESYLKFLMSSSENIKRQTQLGQQFISNGKNYYYITEANFLQIPKSENP